MNLEELRVFIKEKNKNNDYSNAIRKLKEINLSLLTIESSFTHNYRRIAKLFNIIVKHDNKDDFFLLEDSNQKFHIKNSKFIKELYRKEELAIIKNKFSKHPTIAKKLEYYLTYQLKTTCFSKSLELARAISNEYIKNKKIFSNEGLDLSDYDLSITQEWENLYDKMESIRIVHEKKKFTESFFSKKNKYLITDKTYDYCFWLKNSGMSKQELREGFFNKLAKYHNPIQFNQALKEFVERNDGWSKVNVKLKLKKEKINIIKEINNLILIEIKSFKEIQKFGSQNWCIVTEKKYYNEYLSGLNRQFILYNFNREYTDNDFMIGITTDAYGNYQVAHDNHDNMISEYKERLLQEQILNTIEPQSKNKIIKRIQEEINKKTNKTAIVDLIIYYNLIDFGLKWIKKEKINLGEDSIRLSSFVAQYEHEKYLKNINVFPIYDLLHLSKIFVDLDEQIEITKDIAIKILNNVSTNRDVVDIFIKRIKEGDEIEYFNIIEGIKNDDFNYF